MEVVGTSIKKSTKEDVEKIKEMMGTDAHMIDDMRPRDMYKMLRTRAPTSCCRATLAVHRAQGEDALAGHQPGASSRYAGYEGMVELVHEIDKALFNPVWQQVRQPAPWDEVTGAKSRRGDCREAAMPVTTIGDRVCQCATVDRATIQTPSASITSRGFPRSPITSAPPAAAGVAAMRSRRSWRRCALPPGR